MFSHSLLHSFLPALKWRLYTRPGIDSIHSLNLNSGAAGGRWKVGRIGELVGEDKTISLLGTAQFIFDHYLFNIIQLIMSAVKEYKCSDCNFKTVHRKSIRVHIESLHKDITYKCGECKYQATQRGHLRLHIKAKHLKQKYFCIDCGEMFAWQKTLKQHQQSVHNNVKYFCDKCDYTARKKCKLKEHLDSFHNGILYECDKCQYQASLLRSLNSHNRSKHEGVRYPCNLCDYQAYYKSNLSRHTNSIHSKQVVNQELLCESNEDKQVLTQTSSYIKPCKILIQRLPDSVYFLIGQKQFH